MTINCSICGVELTDPASIIAGIGPDCHKKIRFSERLQSTELLSIAGGKSAAEHVKENQTLIFKYKDIPENGDYQNSAQLATVLAKNHQELLLLDRTKTSKIYNREKSMAKAILESICKSSTDKMDYVTDIILPLDPDLKRDYNQFTKNHRETLIEREKIEKELLERGINKFYQKVAHKENMSRSQLIAREELMEHKRTNVKDYKLKWNLGFYQRATWLSRMEKTKNKETYYLLNSLKEDREFIDLDIKDHGLTDEEIYNGLKNSRQKLESILFKAYIESNRNLRLMVTLFKNLPKLEVQNKMYRIKAILALSKMSTGKPYTKEDLKEDLKLKN